MHRKTVLKPYTLADAVSMAASFTGSPTSIEFMDRALLQIICTGTPTGTVTVQGSLEYDSTDSNGSNANWFDLPLSLTALSGSAQTYFVDIQQTALRWIRVKYVRSSGTGAMTAKISAKES